MAIFTAALVAGALGIAETAFVATAGAFVLNAAVGVAASLGLSYAAKALSGNQSATASSAADHFGIQGTLQAGGDVPRSFGLGRHVTAGSLAYANTYGSDAKTPNAYLSQVIVVSDLPGERLEEIWVNGEKITLDLSITQDVGHPVIEYRKEGADHLYVKYYDGTQTVADPHLVSEVSSDDRPYLATRVGTGLCYVIVTSLVDDTLFNGFPDCKFVLSGIPLYDPSKDSSAGGSGSQRYSDPSTWGGDGDDLPVVQAYNVLRGIYYSGTWFYGLQGMTAARLPVSAWITQIGKCRVTVTGVSGPEPTYRSGGQVNVDSQSANLVEALLTACQGRLCEVGGSYKTYVGEPDDPSFSFTDGDVLSSEQQTFKPFFGLSSSVNGIQSKYPDPAQGWNTATAPALYRTDLEARDGGRRLMASPLFDFVPYPEQVQRLQKSAILEAQRARTHVIVLPQWAWSLEPGNVVQWTSERNGYVIKSFRIDSVVDRANLDVLLNITEVDSSDYDWNHVSEYKPPTASIGVIVSRPEAQGIVDWFVEPWTLPDSTGIGRRPAIRLSWDGTVPGVVGVQYEVRLASDSSDVTKGRTDQLSAGAVIVSQSLLPTTGYEVRGQYLPSSPRNMLWSDWLPVTTPDVRLSLSDIDDGIRYNVTTLHNQNSEKFDALKAQFSKAIGKLAARGKINKEILNQQSWDHRVELIEKISIGDEAVGASVTHLQSVMESADSTLAEDVLDIDAKFGSGFSSVHTVEEAFASADTAIGLVETNINAKLGSGFSNVHTVEQAISSVDSTYAGITDDITASLGSGFSNVHTVEEAISAVDSTYAGITGDITASLGSGFSNVHTVEQAFVDANSAITDVEDHLNAKLGPDFTSIDTVSLAVAGIGGEVTVDINVNGYVVGTKLINGGAGLSEFVVQADKFQFQLPGYNGNVPIDVLTIGTIGGTAAFGFSGNMYLDGTFHARSIISGTIQTVHLDVGIVTADKMATDSIDGGSASFKNLSVLSAKIGDAAITVPAVRTDAGTVGPTAGTTVSTVTLSIDTTGLSGKTIAVLASWVGALSYTGTGAAPAATMTIGGTGVQTITTTNSQDSFIALTGSATFTASGGVDTKIINVNYAAGATGNPVLAQRTLWAMAAKR